MTDPIAICNAKRGALLVRNLKQRHFDACYCENRQQALEKALEWIPEGSLVGWGGARSAEEIGLMDALRAGNYRLIDRDACRTPEERSKAARDCLDADVFLAGANGLSLDGQMVSIDGYGNRLAAIAFGPKTVLIVAGMNKVADTLEQAVTRARTVAAPRNAQRFDVRTPCKVTGACGDCKSEDCICNQILITRHCRPAGRIRFLLVGEDLGF